MKSLLSKIIGPEKVGFMPGREAKTLIIHHANNSKIKGFLLSTDAEKAFDRVSWDYMFSTCSFIGMGSNMLNWIKALYQNPDKLYLFKSNKNMQRNPTGMPSLTPPVYTDS